MSLIFLPGATNGESVCVNVTLLTDQLVECEEDFTVVLALDTVGDSVSLGNSSTAVTLLDSDGTDILAVFRWHESKMH